MWRKAGRRLYIGSSAERQVVDRFTQRYLESQLDASWMGMPTSTPPTDLWNYQEILHGSRPELVVARATPNAGYLSTLGQLADCGEVFAWEGHEGGDGERRRLDTVAERARGKSSVMVVLGSGDLHAHLPAQLRRLGALVTPGNYLIVEDTSSGSAHPEARSAAVAAIAEFVEKDRSFFVDRAPEKFYLTFNAGGYLRRRC